MIRVMFTSETGTRETWKSYALLSEYSNPETNEEGFGNITYNIFNLDH